MHQEVTDFVCAVREKHQPMFRSKHVVEFGSFNVNGSVRTHFRDCEYVGVDVHEGPDVDVVCKASEYEGAPADVVVSCEMLEHDSTWQVSLFNMYEILKSGGLMVLTCATNKRPPHGEACPWITHYGNIAFMELILTLQPSIKFRHFGTEVDLQDIRFWGIKR